MKSRFAAIIQARYSDEQFAKEYYSRSKSGLKPYETDLVEKYLKNCKDVLVVGCGCGRETVPLVLKGFNITAIDISKEMVKQTKRLCRELKAKANVYEMDAANLNFKDNSFDAALLFNCLIDQVPSHENRKKVCNELWRVLKPNGVCIAISNNALYPGKRLCYWLEHIKEIPSFIAHWRRRDFFDRVYEDGTKVYVHLSTPFYLKRLFKKRFSILALTSTENISCPRKGITRYLAPIIAVVSLKEEA
ncbi:MAG: class I SAM-dependent methyltransferase [Nanoarchaeota archaeon]|nr:class I SAM-dependent methyltransferase [Nanoarchaeota archaeon]